MRQCFLNLFESRHTKPKSEIWQPSDQFFFILFEIGKFSQFSRHSKFSWRHTVWGSLLQRAVQNQRQKSTLLIRSDAAKTKCNTHGKNLYSPVTKRKKSNNNLNGNKLCKNCQYRKYKL
jgi:hypothetical protein